MRGRCFNLMSPGAARRRRLRVRATRWRRGLAAYGVCCTALIIAGSGVATGAGSSAAAELRVRLGEVEAQVKEARAERMSLRPQVEVAEAIRDRPRWRLLLEALDARLDEEVVLHRLAVRPAGEGGLESARRLGFIVELRGYAPSAGGATRLTLDLESLGVFTTVTLLEAKGASVLARDAVEFRVRCTIEPREGGAP